MNEELAERIIKIYELLKQGYKEVEKFDDNCKGSGP